MNKILIALNNRKLLSIFEAWVHENGDKDLLLLARDVKEAIKMLKTHKVSIVITELMNLSYHDGFDLLSFLFSYAPKTQICTIVNTEETIATDDIVFEASHIGLRMFRRPKRLLDVVSIISLLAENDFKIPPVAKISLVEIFKLIEIEKKICLIEVSTPFLNKKGLLYFDHGVLYDAFWADLEGEDAVLEMMSWKEFEFNFKALPLQTPFKNIDKTLDMLIKEKESYIA